MDYTSKKKRISYDEKLRFLKEIHAETPYIRDTLVGPYIFMNGKPEIVVAQISSGIGGLIKGIFSYHSLNQGLDERLMVGEKTGVVDKTIDIKNDPYFSGMDMYRLTRGIVPLKELGMR